MKPLHRIIPETLVIFLLFSTATGQAEDDLKSHLEQLTETNARSYVRPLVTSTGIGLNSGVFHTARVHGLLGFDLSLNTSIIRIPRSAMTYTFDTAALNDLSLTDYLIDGYNVSLQTDKVYSPVKNAPTVFGSHNPPPVLPDKTYAETAIVTSLASQSGLSEEQVRSRYFADIRQVLDQLEPLGIIPGGIFDLNYWVVPDAQLSLGFPYGTELQLRYLPAIPLEGKEKFTLFGAGGRLDVDQFIPIPFFPLDIATGIFFQKVGFGSVKIRSTLYHIEVSKRVPLLTFYGGLGYETTQMHTDYYLFLYNQEPIFVNMAVRGGNHFRGTLGLLLHLTPLNIHLGCDISAYPSLNLGLDLSFR